MEGRTHQTQQQLNSLLASLLHWGGLEEVCLGLNYTPLNQSLIIEVEKGLVSATPPFLPTNTHEWTHTHTHIQTCTHTNTELLQYCKSIYGILKRVAESINLELDE